MCTEVFNKDTKKTATSPQELREMFGIKDLIISEHYSKIYEDCCLCSVDCKKSAEIADYMYKEIDYDPMDVEIWKEK